MKDMIDELVKQIMRSMIMTTGDGVKLTDKEYRMLGISMVLMSIRFAPAPEYFAQAEQKVWIFS